MHHLRLLGGTYGESVSQQDSYVSASVSEYDVLSIWWKVSF